MKRLEYIAIETKTGKLLMTGTYFKLRNRYPKGFDVEIITLDEYNKRKADALARQKAIEHLKNSTKL